MIFIFLLALILFGPKKLPEIGREIGKFMAEFKRASNDFTSQLQSEIEKVGTEVTPPAQSGGGQQSSSVASFTQTLLPPAVKNAISEIDDAHERLMGAARMAFEAQNFTLRPPEAPVVASSQPAAAQLPSETNLAQSNEAAVAQESSPVEAAGIQPTHSPAPANSDSAQQSS